MKFKQRKQAQRKINSHVRALNKNLQEDNLWRGRFVIRQEKANWESFDDHSGGILQVKINIRDKKTGLTKVEYINNYNYKYKLWLFANDFICKDSGVWDNIQEVKNDTTDWSKVK